MLVVMAFAAVCLAPPVDGPVIDGFAPVGRYGGHWGADFEAAPSSPVRAPVSGEVSFAGSVAGMKTITIQAVPGFKVSVSYLSSVGVAKGDRVSGGQAIGSAGVAHGRGGVHLSVRVGGVYVDPELHMGCRRTDITRALRLVAPPRPYPRRRAHRHTRRDVRPRSHRPSPCGGDGPAPVGPRPGGAHAGGVAVAEGGQAGVVCGGSP